MQKEKKKILKLKIGQDVLKMHSMIHRNKFGIAHKCFVLFFTWFFSRKDTGHFIQIFSHGIVILWLFVALILELTSNSKLDYTGNVKPGVHFYM